MDKLLIYKIGLNFWHRRNDLPLSDRNISDFEVSIDDNFVIVELDGSQNFNYKVENVSIKVDSGAIETFTNRIVLINRLKEISYTPYLNSIGLTQNQLLAIQGANTPSIINSFATINDIVDNFIPITGTTEGNSVTGNIVVFDLFKILNINLNKEVKNFFDFDDGSFKIGSSNLDEISTLFTNLEFSTVNVKVKSNVLLSRGLVSDQDFSKYITDLDYTQKVYVDSKVTKGVDDSTTVALSLTQLNAQYPTATTGFKVYCTSIIAGAIVYEKTQTEWIEMNVKKL